MRARTWSTEFKQFLLRGNVIGAAFGGMVQALVKDLLTPLVAAIFGSPDFSRLSFRIHHSVFFYGDFLNALVAFLTVAFALFFFVVKPVNVLTSGGIRSAAGAVQRLCPQAGDHLPVHAGAPGHGSVRGRGRGARGVGVPLRAAGHADRGRGRG